MKKIILASQSRARKKLLKEAGLTFKTIVSNVKEDTKLTHGCARMVVTNAKRKAMDIAKKQKHSIIIGADTVVLVGKKLIGKPKSKKEAFNTLRILSRKPQWVYSGIAVVDSDSLKVITGYEKTKVYMRALSDAQIKAYLEHIPFLEKAGSFDVQGRGGFFIARIEGCYSNVIGLPMAKLAKMLKQVGVNVL